MLESIPPSWKTAFENEYKAHGIEFRKLDTLEVGFTKANLTNIEDESAFNRLVREAHAVSVGKSLVPYCFALAFIGQNVRKATDILSGLTEIDGNQTDTIIEAWKGTFLWIGIDDADWFKTGTCKNLDTGETRPVTEEMCTPNMNRYYGNPFQYDSVKVDTSNLGKGNWEIRIEVNIISSFYPGYANGNIQVITTNRLGNIPRDADDMSQTIIHETGHLIGMACDASGVLPDKTPDYYYLSGSHCNKPATCVMYLIFNGCTRFCDDCEIAVKKVDLKDGIK